MISPHAKTSGISSQSWILDSTLWIPEGLVSDSLSVKPGFLIPIELFTDTAAISNLLDLRSIMGCPGGTRPVFTGAFRVNRELHFIFHGKKAIIITSKHGTTIFFFHYNLSLGNLQKNWPEKCVLILSEYIGSCSCPLGIP